MINITMVSFIRFRLLVTRLYYKVFPVSDTRAVEILEKAKQRRRYPVVKSINDTIDDLIRHQTSITRLGDGEYTLCLGKSIRFQKYEPELARRLRQILKTPNTAHCRVGIIELGTVGLTPYSKMFWLENMPGIRKLFVADTPYFNARISRSNDVGHFEKMKKLWENRNVLFVTGKGSRFDVNHILFTQIKSAKNIESLPQNAWSQYSSLLEQVITEASTTENPLVICSLGPTATVLAFDLSHQGIQTLDLGHLTNCYDRIVNNSSKPEDLPIVNP